MLPIYPRFTLLVWTYHIDTRMSCRRRQCTITYMVCVQIHVCKLRGRQCTMYRRQRTITYIKNDNIQSTYMDLCAHTHTWSGSRMSTHCNTLKHTATHGNTLQHTHTSTHEVAQECQHTATHCDTLQHTATHTHKHTWGGSRMLNPASHIHPPNPSKFTPFCLEGLVQYTSLSADPGGFSSIHVS